jgi:hypothetical protein
MNLYLSLIPEALIASMLPPEEFGAYLAVGTRRRTLGQAMFFSVEGLKSSPVFDLEEARRRCVPHPSGEPKHSVYLAVYRVLEQVPQETLTRLYLVTPDGKVLGLERGAGLPDFQREFHLYQEICPVHPRIVSGLDPAAFVRHVTSPGPIHLPRLCFADLRLGALAEDPERGSIHDLPYYAIEHLRDCLIQLKNNPGKGTKIVDRVHPQSFPYRSVETGLYLGDARNVAFFRFPSTEELQSKYYDWWRSASIMGDLQGGLA